MVTEVERGISEFKLWPSICINLYEIYNRALVQVSTGQPMTNSGCVFIVFRVDEFLNLGKVRCKLTSKRKMKMNATTRNENSKPASNTSAHLFMVDAMWTTSVMSEEQISSSSPHLFFPNFLSILTLGRTAWNSNRRYRSYMRGNLSLSLPVYGRSRTQYHFELIIDHQLEILNVQFVVTWLPNCFIYFFIFFRSSSWPFRRSYLPDFIDGHIPRNNWDQDKITRHSFLWGHLIIVSQKHELHFR